MDPLHLVTRLKSSEAPQADAKTMEKLLQVLSLDLLQPLKHTGGQHFLVLGSAVHRSEGRKNT